MHVFKVIVSIVGLVFALPVFVVGALGIALSPLQPHARATEPRVVLDASDIAWGGEPAAEAFEEPAGELADEAVEQPDGQPDGQLAGESSEEPIGDCDENQAANPVEQPSAPEGGFAGMATEQAPETAGWYSSDQLRVQGVIYDGGSRYTWYSQRVLPGGGLDIEGRHVSSEGYVVDAQERIVVASSDLPRGTELEVPFGCGRAIVLDTGCDAGVIDVYTDF